MADAFLKAIESALLAMGGPEGMLVAKGMKALGDREAEAKKKAAAAKARIAAQPAPAHPRTAKEESAKAKRTMEAMLETGRRNTENREVNPDHVPSGVAGPSKAEYADVTGPGPQSTGEDFAKGPGEFDFMADLLPPEDRAGDITAKRETNAARKFFGAPVDDEINNMEVIDHYEDGSPAIVGGFEYQPPTLGGAAKTATARSSIIPEAPRALPVVPDQGKLNELFRVATGTKFDPASRRDAAYMSKIKRAFQENPDYADLSPKQFAAKLYAMG